MGDTRYRGRNSVDRFIPSRRSLDIDVAHSKLLHRPDENLDETPRQYKKENTRYLERLSNILGRLEARIYPFSATRRVYEDPSDPMQPGYYKVPQRDGRRGRVPTSPDCIMDMPGLRDDFYTNLLDWSARNMVAVALYHSAYIWNAERKDCHRIDIAHPDAGEFYLTALTWDPSGKQLALADNKSELMICDVESLKMEARVPLEYESVGVLKWSDIGIIYGTYGGEVHIHDWRCAKQTKCVNLIGHKKEVCGLALSPSSTYLASGGDDGIVRVWDLRMANSYAKFEAHKSCAKALAWCPWRPSILATGGGSKDGYVKLWHVHTGKEIGEGVFTKSQVCSMFWSKQYSELVTAHGSVIPEKNDIILWNMRRLQFEPVGVLRHHLARPLHLALSPDQTTFVSAGADEALCLWKCFPIGKESNNKPDFSSKITMAGIIR